MDQGIETPVAACRKDPSADIWVISQRVIRTNRPPARRRDWVVVRGADV